MIKSPELLFVCFSPRAHNCLFSLFSTKQQQQQPSHTELLAIADAASYDCGAKADPAPIKVGCSSYQKYDP